MSPVCQWLRAYLRGVGGALATLSVAAGALLLGSTEVAAQYPLPPETGDVCVAHYARRPQCTAQDVRIASLSPALQDVCLVGGDTVTLQFTAEITTGATARYDIGLFVSLDGTSALTGTNCYHDVLQPASATEFNPVGGPFRQIDFDYCADTLQTDPPVYYTLQQAITVPCLDGNGDGVADAFSTCTSWETNWLFPCFSVTMAVPRTPAKCSCQTVEANPPILVYQGYDWGDLPDGYATLEASDGPRHTVHQDLNNDGSPDTQGGVAAVWLGPRVDLEADGQPSAGALGDDISAGDDEDGVLPILPWTPDSATGASVQVTVNSSTGSCTNCRLGFWIDWNEDGDFSDNLESYVSPVSVGMQTITFATPVVLPETVYARFRLYDGAHTAELLPGGLVLNGEVEDYQITLGPTAVELSSFAARAQPSAPALLGGALLALGAVAAGGFLLWRRRAWR